MPLKQQREIAGQLMKCGTSRVRFTSEADVAEALTRDDIRRLIAREVIYKIQKRGTSRGHAREILRQKKRGRRRGPGSVKGKWGSRNPSKEQWMKNIRTLRRLLSELRDSDQLTKKDYRMLYGKAKGGTFRSKKHMMLHIKEEELLNKGSSPAERTASKAKHRENKTKARAGVQAKNNANFPKVVENAAPKEPKEKSA